MKTIKLTCETCGKEFYRYPKAVGRFCSRKCYHDSRQQDLISPRKCKKCGIVKSIEHYTERKERGGQRTYICDDCRRKIYRQTVHRSGRQRPKEQSRECSAFLGVVVAESALSKFFDHIERMPYGNPGYDFLCGKGFKIDVKSSCLHAVGHSSRWEYMIRKNQITDYFLLLAIDNRDNIIPQHVWLVPGSAVNHLDTLSISSNPDIIKKWSQYERPLNKVVMPTGTAK